MKKRDKEGKEEGGAEINNGMDRTQKVTSEEKLIKRDRIKKAVK
jgi:hypothetical protein